MARSTFKHRATYVTWSVTWARGLSIIYFDRGIGWTYMADQRRFEKPAIKISASRAAAMLCDWRKSRRVTIEASVTLTGELKAHRGR